MRLLALLTLLLVVHRAVAESFYNAETCGRSLTQRSKRSAVVAMQNSGEDVVEQKRNDEDEEEEEVEEEAGTTVEATTLGEDEDEAEEMADLGADDESQTEKVMGGMDAGVGELPWATLITVTRDVGGASSFCGGTLISSRHVITAAHCFFKGTMETGRCSLGQMMSEGEIKNSTRLTIGGSCASAREGDCRKEEVGEPALVKKVIFTSPFFEDECRRSLWDVALLELDVDISTPHACLPHLHNMDRFNFANAEMHSFGYGNDPTKGVKFNRRLQKVNLGLPHDSRRCQDKWRLPFDWLVCTKESATKNVCSGDSGGGVLAKHQGRFHLLGWISFGSSCDVALQNAGLANAQVNMDVNLYTATIDQHILRQTPSYWEKWREPRTNNTDRS